MCNSLQATIRELEKKIDSLITKSEQQKSEPKGRLSQRNGVDSAEKRGNKKRKLSTTITTKGPSRRHIKKIRNLSTW